MPISAKPLNNKKKKKKKMQTKDPLHFVKKLVKCKKPSKDLRPSVAKDNV